MSYIVQVSIVIHKVEHAIIDGFVALSCGIGSSYAALSEFAKGKQALMDDTRVKNDHIMPFTKGIYMRFHEENNKAIGHNDAT